MGDLGCSGRDDLSSPFNEEYWGMPVPPGVFGKKLCRLGFAQPRSLKLTSLMRLLKPVITLQDRQA